MEFNYHDVYHFLLLFNHQQEPILSIYDDYTTKILINPYQNLYCSNSNHLTQPVSVPNILMQVFSPVLASQAAMLDTLKMRFSRIVLANDKVLILHRVQYCTMFILLTENCQFRHHAQIINKKLELIEWVLSSFYGICWNQMKVTTDKWLKLLLKELWLMDYMEFNLAFMSVERLDLLSTNQNLTEKIVETLMSNARYMKQISEKRLKHQLILAGSKLYTLYSTDLSNNLKSKHILLFILVCNAVFNRFSRVRDYIRNDNSSNNLPPINSNNEEDMRKIAKRSTILSSFFDSFTSTNEDENRELSKAIHMSKSFMDPKVGGDSSSISSISDMDNFVLWVENKDGYKYRIVRIFLNFNNSFLTPCNLHLIKLARNVIYVGLEEDLENSHFISNLDKSIRLLRRIINDQNQRKDVIPILKGRICQAIEKLTYQGVLNSLKLKMIFKQIMKELYNYDSLERLMKELLRNLELIYIEFYLSPQVKVQERLCKCFLRCFISIKKMIADFVSILSVKALRHLPLTSLYPLYPGLIQFIITVRKSDNFLISPVIDYDFMNQTLVFRLHLYTDLIRKLASHCDDKNNMAWRYFELWTNDMRCTYFRRRLKDSGNEEKDMELTIFHNNDVTNLQVKNQIDQLIAQFLSDFTFQCEIRFLSFAT